MSPIVSFLLISVASLVWTAPPSLALAGTAQEAASQVPHPVSPEDPPAEHRRVAERIHLIQLHRIHQGKFEKTVLTSSDLQTTLHLDVSGYVSGIVVLCDDEMAVSVDGRQMSPIRIGIDGSLWLKNFGRMRPEGLFSREQVHPSGVGESQAASAAKRGSVLAGGYTFFPAVSGDAVSPEPLISIRFQAGAGTLVLAVRQHGYTNICSVVPEKLLAREPIPFFHAGPPAAGLSDRFADDFKARINAVAKGIGTVEAAFADALVDGVTLIDLTGPYNAVTCSGRRRIWFYNTAFFSEPLDELVVIAEHESLHILVDLLQLADSTLIRELFADLRGYDDLSLERLELVTTGRLPARPSGNQHHHSPLLAFISEKHFLRGAKGGHAQADPEEFCTSFLHSLMYIGGFDEALFRPIQLSDSRIRQLTAQERKTVRDDYGRALQVFAQALGEQGYPSGSAAAKSAGQLVWRLEQARAVMGQAKR
jgi:hypothetical protein